MEKYRLEEGASPAEPMGSGKGTIPAFCKARFLAPTLAGGEQRARNAANDGT